MLRQETNIKEKENTIILSYILVSSVALTYRKPRKRSFFTIREKKNFTKKQSVRFTLDRRTNTDAYETADECQCSTKTQPNFSGQLYVQRILIYVSCLCPQAVPKINIKKRKKREKEEPGIAGGREAERKTN